MSQIGVNICRNDVRVTSAFHPIATKSRTSHRSATGHKLTSVPATRILGYSYAAARRLSGGHTVGALGGATVNYAFIERFQDMARGHVIVRRLERAYGKEVVRREYERLAQDS
jgi:hypothetical protein